MFAAIKIKINVILPLLVLLLSIESKANYQVETFPKTMTSIQGNPNTVIIIPPTTLNTEVTVNLPFSFYYFGQSHGTVDVNSNGFIAFTPLIGNEFDYFNQPLPHVHTPDGVVALFWDDLNVYGSISYLVEGTFPNRKIIIEYSSLGDLAGNTNILTGQIHLYETTNIIEFHYGIDAAPFVFPTATIGLENHDATIGIGGPNTDSNNDIPSDNYRFTPQYHAVSGVIHGLLDGNELMIQNNSDDTLSVYSSGSFTMPTLVYEGSMYDISLVANPVEQECIVFNSTGTIGQQNVDDVVINCSSTINAGNASFSYAHNLFSSNLPQIDFLLSGRDYTYTDWWYYRIAGDSREHIMPAPDWLYTTNLNSTLVLMWSDVDNRGVFDAELHISLSQTDPDGAMLNQQFKLVNLTNQDSNIELFKYADYDLSNNASDDAILENDPDYIKISGIDGQNTLLAELRSGGNDSYQVAIQPIMYNIFNNDEVDNLSNSGLPFNSGDFTAAFQWHHTVPAHGWINTTVTAAIGNTSAEEPADPVAFGIPRNINVVVENLVPGNEITFQNNGTDDMTVTNNGTYAFSIPVVDGDFYDVIALDPPVSNTQQCYPSNSEFGTVNGDDVEIVFVCKYREGEITDGNAKLTYQSYDFGVTTFQIDNTRINLAKWYYRTDIDTEEIKFPKPDTSAYNGNSVDFDWFDVDNRGYFSAQLTQTIEQDVATGAIVTNTLIINSLVPFEATIHLFNYVDFDVAGPLGDEAALLSSNNNYIAIIDNATQNSINMAEFRAGAGTSYQIGEYNPNTGIYGMFLNNDVDNLNNTGSPTGPADVDMAFQWSYPIPANGSLVLQSIYAGGSSIAPVPADPVILEAVIFKNGFEN